MCVKFIALELSSENFLSYVYEGTPILVIPTIRINIPNEEIDYEGSEVYQDLKSKIKHLIPSDNCKCEEVSEFERKSTFENSASWTLKIYVDAI